MLMRGAPWISIWVGCWFSTAGKLAFTALCYFPLLIHDLVSLFLASRYHVSL